MSLTDAPAAVRKWFALDGADDPEAALRAMLAPDAAFTFGGLTVRGVEDVVNTIGFMMPPGWLGPVEWRVIEPFADGAITVRGTSPGDALLPSPGGPMDYIDFHFTLAADSRIAAIVPEPHQPEPADLPPPLAIGAIAPDFSLPDVEGRPVPLHGHDGPEAATVITFVCNHCPWSLRWHDRLQRVARDYHARGVRFLQINPDDPAIHAEDGVEHSRRRVADGAFAGPYLVDAGQAVARRWGVRLTSELFVLDAAGSVAFHGAPDADPGDPALDAAWLRAALDAVLAGTSPDPARRPPAGCAIKWTW